MALTSEQSLLTHHRLLRAVTEAQMALAQGQPAQQVFDMLLAAAMELTGSAYVFIGEVVPTPEGPLTLKALAVRSTGSLTFSQLQGLCNDVLASGLPVVSPLPQLERLASTPLERTTPLWSFLGLPLHSREGLVGLVGLANAPGCYDDSQLAFLKPLQATCCTVLQSLRQEQRQREAEDELRQAQERLLAVERMASLGTLTAGVAHEINNPLAYMLSNLNYVSEELNSLVQSGQTLAGERAQDILEALSETLSGSTRVRDIVRDLRLFSRAPREQQVPLDLHTLLDSCVNIVWGELKHRGRLVKDYGDVPPLHGNESRLAQVFLNLIVNAVQALPHHALDASKIRISTRHEDGLVMVAIHDTGMGIPEQHLARLFEPFFTTKPAGEGTGLGLSICQGIVKAMGGRITVESQEGQGSTFRVFLPVGTGTLSLYGSAA